MRDAKILLLLCTPIREFVRFAYSTRLANRLQPKRGARNNTSLWDEGARISENWIENFKKKGINIRLIRKTISWRRVGLLANKNEKLIETLTIRLGEEFYFHGSSEYTNFMSANRILLC